MIELLGHFQDLARYCDLCSIGIEDAVRIAQELEIIRKTSQATATAVDTWWHEFCGTLASLQDLYSDIKAPTQENEALQRQARDLVKDGTRTGAELYEPLRSYLGSIEAKHKQVIEDLAIDLLDSAIIKLYSMTC